MNKLKMILGSSVSTLALVLGVAVVPASAATSTDCNGAMNCNDTTVTTTVNDDSPTNNGGTQANNGGTAVTVSGDCSAAFVGDNDNYGGASSGNMGGNIGGALLGSNDQSNSQSSSASNSQNAGNSFNADCSTSNVTNVTQAAAEVEEAEAVQVSAPKGGVHAGFGGASETSSSAAVIAGLTGSLSILGVGLRFLKGEM
jgi:hypothetical protein